MFRVFLFLVISLSLLTGGVLAEATSSVGVAGPPQVFTGKTGENITSYVRVYNEGNETGNYRVTITGNVSTIAVLETESLTIPPGENRRVSIVYVAPVEEAYYEGVLSVSIEGNQIVPGVTKQISITLERPVGNRPPRVRIVFPKENETLTGDVDVAADADDPDGDGVTFAIYIDGSLVAEKATYLWRTKKWDNGEHELKVVASDSNLTSEVIRYLVVDNPPRGPALAYGLAIVFVVVVVSFFVIRKLSRRTKPQ